MSYWILERFFQRHLNYGKSLLKRHQEMICGKHLQRHDFADAISVPFIKVRIIKWPGFCRLPSMSLIINLHLSGSTFGQIVSEG